MVKKLLKTDYTAEELKKFPDAPYWDEDEDTVIVDEIEKGDGINYIE